MAAEPVARQIEPVLVPTAEVGTDRAVRHEVPRQSTRPVHHRARRDVAGTPFGTSSASPAPARGPVGSRSRPRRPTR